MKNIWNYLAGFAILLFILFTGGCGKENDFYFVGRQPVELRYPNDTVITLDYTDPEKVTVFSWESKRPYIEFNLKFGLNKDFSGNVVEKVCGLASSYPMPAIKMDSLLTTLEVPAGNRVNLYWTVVVKDPNSAWCDETRVIDITRFDIPDSE
jgi:hypothetical protein